MQHKSIDIRLINLKIDILQWVNKVCKVEKAMQNNFCIWKIFLFLFNIILNSKDLQIFYDKTH